MFSSVKSNGGSGTPPDAAAFTAQNDSDGDLQPTMCIILAAGLFFCCCNITFAGLVLGLYTLLEIRPPGEVTATVGDDDDAIIVLGM